MEISIIVAMTPQGLIGKKNQIPWHLPADLKRFKKITMGYPIIMGRKTFESLPGLLPGRQHIVLTKNKDYQAVGCDVVTNWEDIAQHIKNKAFVIGGSKIYEYALPIAKYIYMTIVYANVSGDTYFPKWNQSEWQEVEREYRKKDENNIYDIENILYKRK
jgi:dihydrofolate reductase